MRAPTTACPASGYATSSFCAADRVAVPPFFSSPTMTRSTAPSISSQPTVDLAIRAAEIAASFIATISTNTNTNTTHTTPLQLRPFSTNSPNSDQQPQPQPPPPKTTRDRQPRQRKRNQHAPETRTPEEEGSALRQERPAAGGGEEGEGGEV